MASSCFAAILARRGDASNRRRTALPVAAQTARRAVMGNHQKTTLHGIGIDDRAIFSECAPSTPLLGACVRVQVRVTSDSSARSVSVADTRSFIHAGLSLSVDRPPESEDVLTDKGRVLDQVT